MKTALSVVLLTSLAACAGTPQDANEGMENLGNAVGQVLSLPGAAAEGVNDGMMERHREKPYNNPDNPYNR